MSEPDYSNLEGYADQLTSQPNPYADLSGYAERMRSAPEPSARRPQPDKASEWDRFNRDAMEDVLSHAAVGSDKDIREHVERYAPAYRSVLGERFPHLGDEDLDKATQHFSQESFRALQGQLLKVHVNNEMNFQKSGLLTGLTGIRRIHPQEIVDAIPDLEGGRLGNAVETKNAASALDSGNGTMEDYQRIARNIGKARWSQNAGFGQHLWDSVQGIPKSIIEYATMGKMLDGQATGMFTRGAARSLNPVANLASAIEGETPQINVDDNGALQITPGEGWKKAVAKNFASSALNNAVFEGIDVLGPQKGNYVGRVAKGLGTFVAGTQAAREAEYWSGLTSNPGFVSGMAQAKTPEERMQVLKRFGAEALTVGAAEALGGMREHPAQATERYLRERLKESGVPVENHDALIADYMKSAKAEPGVVHNDPFVSEGAGSDMGPPAPGYVPNFTMLPSPEPHGQPGVYVPNFRLAEDLLGPRPPSESFQELSDRLRQQQTQPQPEPATVPQLANKLGPPRLPYRQIIKTSDAAVYEPPEPGLVPPARPPLIGMEGPRVPLLEAPKPPPGAGDAGASPAPTAAAPGQRTAWHDAYEAARKSGMSIDDATAAANKAHAPGQTWLHSGTKFEETPEGFYFTSDNGERFRIGMDDDYARAADEKKHLYPHGAEQVRVIDSEGRNAGKLSLLRNADDTLTAINVDNNTGKPGFGPKTKGIGRAMYDFVTDAGATVKRSTDQTKGAGGGKSFWDNNSESAVTAQPFRKPLLDRMRAKSATDATATAQPGQAPRSEKRGVPAEGPTAEGPTAEGPAEQLVRAMVTGKPANDQAVREAARQKILDDRLRIQSAKKSDRMQNYHDAVEDALASPDAKKLDRLAQVLVNIGEEADAKNRPIEEVAKQYLPKLAEKLGDEQFNELVAHVKESANDARGLDKAALANGIKPSSVRRSIAEKLSQQAPFAQAADADQGNALLGGGKGKGQGAEASSAGEGGVAAGSPVHAAGGEAGGDELAGLKALRARFTRARDAMQAELQRSFPSGKRPEGEAGRGWDDRVAQIQEAEANIAKVEEQMDAARHAALVASGRPVSPSLVPLRQKAAMGLIRQEPEIGPYYTAPPPATIERAVGVHKSGDEQAWTYMKDALRRNYNHEWTDWFINGLGNQKIAKRAVPTNLRGINRKIEAEARHYYEDLQMQEELMHHEAQKAGAEHSPAEIAEAVRSGLQDGHNATADEAARHVAPPAESGDAANDDAAHDGRGDAADAGLHADEDFNFGANGSDDGRSIGDTGRSGLKSLADFLTDDTGTAFLNYDKIKQVTGIDIPLRVQELYDGLVTMARAVKDTFVKLGGKMFPATSRLNEEAGNKMAQLANSQDYARRQLPRLIDKVVGPGATEDFRRKVGSVLTEMHLRHTKQAYEGYASDSLAQADQIRQSLDDLPNRNDLSPEAKAQTRRLGLKRIKELHAAAEEASKIAGNVTSIIGKPNHPLASEADFAQAQADPDVKQAIERYKTFFVPEMEANFAKYKGIDHPDSIGDFTQIPDLPMNLLAIKGDGSPQTGVPGTMRGNLKNLKEKYNVFATQRKGNAENYESDLAAIMENSLIRSDRLAKRADLDRYLVSEGLASWGKRGQRIDGATEFPFVQPPKGTQTDQRGESSLYVHNDVAKEYRQLLGVDEPFKIPVLTQLSGIPTWASLASTIEAAYHTKNLLTALSRPGVNPVDIFTNAFKVFRGDPVIADRLVELARIGATKPSEELDTGKGKLLPSKFQKVDPTYWLNRFMNVVDAGMRVTLDDAFNRLAEGRWITGATVENTEANRRDFINQALGQYNKLAQAKIVTALRDSGLGPFATAGTGFYMNGLRALHFDPGVSAKTWKGQLALRAEVAARAAGLLATTAAINYLLWGRVDGDDATPLGAMKVGQTEDGRSRYFDLLNLFTGVPRGLRETGLLAATDGLRRGRTAGQIADRAQDDMLTSLLHPGVGPFVQFAYTAATGKNEIGQRVAKEAEPGSSQAWENLKSAIAQANPVYSSLSAANKVKGEPPSMFDRTLELAGPFAPKSRLDPAISDYFDALNNAKKAKLEATRRGVNLQGDMARQYRATHLAEKRMLELGEAIRGLRKVNGHLVQGQPPEPDRVQYLRRQQLQLARTALQAFGQY